MRQSSRLIFDKLYLRQRKEVEKMDIGISSSKKQKGFGVARLARICGRAVLWLGLGAALGRVALPFGAMPLGLALVCSSSAYALAALAGVIISMIGIQMHSAIPILCAYAVALLLRIIFSLAVSEETRASRLLERIFCEPIYLRAVAAAVAAFALGAYRLATGGFLYYDLFGTVIGVVVAFAGALLFGSLSLEQNERQRVSYRIWRDAGFVALSAAAVFSLREYSPYGISLSVLVCMLVTLYSVKKRGVSFGIIVSIAAGLCVSVVYAPLFIFAAVCYGFLSQISEALGCFSAFLAGIAWGVYMNGVSAFLSLFAALLGATLMFFVAERLFLSDGKEQVRTAENDAYSEILLDGADVAVARLDDSARRIKELCVSLSALSDELMGEDTSRMNSGVRESSGSALIFAEIGEDGAVVKKSGVRSNGRLREGKERIYTADELAELSVRDVSDGEQSFALDLAAISDYIADIMSGNDYEYQSDEKLASKIGERLRDRIKDASIRVGVFGGRRRRVIVCCDELARLRAALPRIEKEIRKQFDLSFSAREPFELGARAYAVLEQRAILKVTFAERKRNAAGQSACGDSVGTVCDERGGRAYAFISDGMGCGERAARASQTCTTFLHRLLPINEGSFESIRSTLGVINGYMRRHNLSSAQECSATVDLGVFDLIEGKVSFYKSGAAPTFVIRDGSLFKLRCKSVPIGIISEADFGRVNMELLAGDVLVMVSDGITDGREESRELFELLRSRVLTHSADQLADVIIEYADRIGCVDDVSVVVAKIDDGIF